MKGLTFLCSVSFFSCESRDEGVITSPLLSLDS